VKSVSSLVFQISLQSKTNTGRNRSCAPRSTTRHLPLVEARDKPGRLQHPFAIPVSSRKRPSVLPSRFVHRLPSRSVHRRPNQLLGHDNCRRCRVGMRETVLVVEVVRHLETAEATASQVLGKLSVAAGMQPGQFREGHPDRGQN